MQTYQCIDCGAMYDDKNKPSNMVCKLSTCPGQGLTGALIPIQTTGNPNQGSGPSSPPPTNHQRELGLCILLMDASGSMGDPAFGFEGNCPPSVFDASYIKSLPNLTDYEKNGLMSKRQQVSAAAAAAIFGLESIAKPEDAYISAIKFDHTQAQMFTKSIKQITTEFATAMDFAKYLLKELCTLNGGTDITAALKMGKSISEKFLQGSISAFGSSYKALVHSQYIETRSETIDLPNVRVLIYSDGEHQTDYFGDLYSPFAGSFPDLLMGAFIGKETDKGCRELKGILSKCPRHDHEQFFLIDKPDKVATLRGIFRMASGSSGFCPKCLPNQQR